MRYQSGSAFRRALETRLRDQSLASGLPLVRLRKMVAFDRLLARLIRSQPDQWVLKGGLALQLRLGDRARTTKDIDLLSLTEPNRVFDSLREAVSLDLGDWFNFEVGLSGYSLESSYTRIKEFLDPILTGEAWYMHWNPDSWSWK